MKQSKVSLVIVLSLELMANIALANIGSGSQRVPLTDFLIELYNVTNNVYVPLIGAACIAFAAANLLFGFMRFGPMVGKVFGVIGILTLGVTWFGQTVGGTVAIGLLA